MKIRNTYADENFIDFIELGIESYDCPQPPANMLIDDINKVVVEWTKNYPEPGYHSYKAYPYPPSHHVS